ncbi:TRAP transporter small permease [Sedimentibacter sp.]|uniref:TRAP transporter small permease n=1 Tax=Sedimentibacter sp. TaxID=1960295 RepID=UPI00289DA13D|nr:TRAP transporter small permease [Sedimentibacter sp.]
MKTINRVIDICIEALSAIAALSLAFLLIGICYSTFSRVAFNKPLSNLVEYSTYSLLYVTFLGAPQILKNKGHINLDIVTNALPSKVNNILSLCIDVVGAIICACIFYFGLLVVTDNYNFSIKVMDSMGTPMWLLTIVIPVGMFFLVIQFIRNFFNDYDEFKKYKKVV